MVKLDKKLEMNLGLNPESSVNRVMDHIPSKKTKLIFIKGTNVKQKVKMFKGSFKLLCVFIMFIVSSKSFGQGFKFKDFTENRMICDCEFNISKDYTGEIWIYKDEWNRRDKYMLNFDTLHTLKDMDNMGIDYQKPESYIRNEQIFCEVPMNTIIGVSKDWKNLDDQWISVICKIPFDTYIDKNKNFDIMFFLSEDKKPKLVIKNYFTNVQKNSLSKYYLMIGDDEYSIEDGFYNNEKFTYKEEAIFESSGSRIPKAYRIVSIHSLDVGYTLKEFEQIMRMNEEQQKVMYSDSSKSKRLEQLIKNCVSGNVYIIYETSTGQIKRTLNEAQTTSLREMIEIHKYYKYDDNRSNAYKDREVENKCASIDKEVKEMCEKQMNIIQIYQDSLQKVKKSLLKEKEDQCYEKYYATLQKGFNNIKDTLFNSYYEKIQVYEMPTRKIPKSTPKAYEPIPKLAEFQKQIEDEITSNYKNSKLLATIEDLFNRYEKYILLGERNSIFKDSLIVWATKMYIYEKHNAINQIYSVEKDYAVLKKYSEIIDNITSYRYVDESSLSICIKNSLNYTNSIVLFLENCEKEYMELDRCIKSIR